MLFKDILISMLSSVAYICLSLETYGNSDPIIPCQFAHPRENGDRHSPAYSTAISHCNTGEYEVTNTSPHTWVQDKGHQNKGVACDTNNKDKDEVDQVEYLDRAEVSHGD